MTNKLMSGEVIFRYWCANCGHEQTTDSSTRPSHCNRTMKARGREDKRAVLPHPMQPVEDDGDDVIRFKQNAIVRHLLDNGGIDLNALARLPFSREDHVQFAQLIGYSVRGFGELSYVHDEDYDRAASAAEVVEKHMEAERC